MEQMQPFTSTVLSVNSDISLHGLEMTVVKFTQQDDKEDQWEFQLLNQEQVKFPDELRNHIIETIKFYAQQPTDKFNDLKFNELDKKYGDYVIEQVVKFQKEFDAIDLITFNPILIHLIIRDKDKPKSAIYAAKFGATLSQKTNTKVVCNCFAYDFFLKGNGGPFHVIGQAKLFPKQINQINLSGYASYTSYKADVEVKDTKVDDDKKEDNKENSEFDGYYGQFLSPAMLAMNYLEFTTKQVPQEKQGTPNQEFEKQLGTKIFPYTTQAFFQLMNTIDQSKIPVADQYATIYSIVAKQIKQVIQEQKLQKKEIFVIGNYSQLFYQGVLNEIGQDIKFTKPADSEWQETIILGFIGLRKTKTLLNIFKGATKSLSNNCSGVIFLPNEQPLIIEKSPSEEFLKQFSQPDKNQNKQEEQQDLNQQYQQKQQQPFEQKQVEKKKNLLNSEDFSEGIPDQGFPQALKSNSLKQVPKSGKK